MGGSMKTEKMHPLTKLAKGTVESYVKGKKLPQPKDLTP
jgi:AMMECR1 domain-containing protein